ncbi:MAG: hypothetical protein WD004_00620 [Actinomycetota bacterium]
MTPDPASVAATRRRGVRGWFRAHPAAILAIIFVLTIPAITPFLRGDGVGYYAWLASPIVDGDLRFANEYREGDFVFESNVWVDGQVKPDWQGPDGHIKNQWSVGAAVLWLPFFLLSLAVAQVTRAPGSTGYTIASKWLTALGTAVYTFVGLLLAFQIARRNTGRIPALLGTIGVWFASSLPIYQYFLAFHPPAMAGAIGAALLTVWNRDDGWTLGRWLAMGVIAGLLVITHPVGIAWFALPGISLLGLDRGVLRDRMRAGAVFAGGVVLGALPQLIGKTIVHGSPFDSGYVSEWRFLQPDIRRVLIGAEHGLISWTPIAGLAIAGLVIMFRRGNRRLAAGLLAVFVAMLYFIASIASSEVSSYGNRFFVLFTPGFVIGASVLAATAWEARRRAWRSVIVGGLAILIVWNALFMFQWAWGLVPKRGPVDWAVMVRQQFTTAPREMGHAFTLLLTDRGELMRIVQERDIENFYSGTDV